MATNDGKAGREARLAAALRANLRRRKAVPPGEGEPPPCPAPDADREPLA